MKIRNLILALILLSFTSCANPLATNITSPITRAITNAAPTVALTDSAVLGYANDLSAVYKTHSVTAATIRKGSRSVLAIIETFAFATASRIFSGMSLGISGQQAIWDEKSRSITFTQGASYIDNAIAEYIDSLSTLKSIPKPKDISIPGARLNRRVSAIESVVNLMLIGLVPDMKKLSIATGEDKGT